MKKDKKKKKKENAMSALLIRFVSLWEGSVTFQLFVFQNTIYFNNLFQVSKNWNCYYLDSLQFTCYYSKTFNLWFGLIL